MSKSTFILFSLCVYACQSWSQWSLPSRKHHAECLSLRLQNNGNEDEGYLSRRDYFEKAINIGSIVVTTSILNPSISAAVSAEENNNNGSNTIASTVTDKVFVEIKGLPGPDGSAPTGGTQRIVIGLFGKDSPQSVDKLKRLFGPAGLPATCKPKEERVLQREQLEANKVYNSCIESEDKGVNYDYAQIWRIMKDERIDFGSVAGRFVAREYPSWEEKEGQANLKHDRPGLVSVRKGSNSGFGFTIYPGSSGLSTTTTKDLDDNHIICGQVLEGMDVIELMNNLPVVTSAKVSNSEFREGPSRACRYGGTQLYCNEFKPLQKLTMYQTGVL